MSSASVMAVDDEAIYLAEEEAAALYEAEYMELVNIEAGSLRSYIRTALIGAGWEGSTLPKIRFDVDDADGFSSEQHNTPPDGEYLRFHIDSLTPWIVLHELAHWCRPTNAHGPQFCGVLVGLVTAAIGQTAGETLAEQFARRGVDVDLTWASGVRQGDST